MQRALRETLPLSQLRDGTYVLRAAPSIVCYESYEHNVMTGISILALVVYVFGGPSAAILQRGVAAEPAEFE